MTTKVNPLKTKNDDRKKTPPGLCLTEEESVQRIRRYQSTQQLCLEAIAKENRGSKKSFNSVKIPYDNEVYGKLFEKE